MFFIVNQNAKLGKANIIFETKIKPLLNKKKICFDYVITKTFDETVAQTKKVTEKHKVIVACGGDGTINAVAQGILGTNAVMGVLPLGSANCFATQSLNIPINLKKAVKILLRKRIARIDIGKINEAIFLNTVGVGISGEMTLLGHRRWFYRLFPFIELRYGLPLLERLFLFKPFYLTLKINSQLAFQGKAILMTICNGKGEGKYFVYNEYSGLQDNNLDIMIIEDIPFLKRAELLYKIAIGNINKLKETEKRVVHFFQGSQIQLDLKENSQEIFPCFHVDGEPIELVENYLYRKIFLIDKKTDKIKMFDIKVLPQILPVIVGKISKTALYF